MTPPKYPEGQLTEAEVDGCLRAWIDAWEFRPGEIETLIEHDTKCYQLFSRNSQLHDGFAIHGQGRSLIINRAYSGIGTNLFGPPLLGRVRVILREKVGK